MTVSLKCLTRPVGRCVLTGISRMYHERANRRRSTFLSRQFREPYHDEGDKRRHSHESRAVAPARDFSNSTAGFNRDGARLPAE